MLMKIPQKYPQIQMLDLNIFLKDPNGDEMGVTGRYGETTQASMERQSGVGVTLEPTSDQGGGVNGNPDLSGRRHTQDESGTVDATSNVMGGNAMNGNTLGGGVGLRERIDVIGPNLEW